jgi:hypothetical protein
MIRGKWFNRYGTKCQNIIPALNFTTNPVVGATPCGCPTPTPRGCPIAEPAGKCKKMPENAEICSKTLEKPLKGLPKKNLPFFSAVFFT